MSDYGYYGKKKGRRGFRRFRFGAGFRLRFGFGKRRETIPPNRNSAAKSPKRRSLRLMGIADIVILCFSVACIVLLALAFMAKVVDPNTFWQPAFAALLFPIIFICHIILTLYWVLRWRVVHMIVMGLVLIACIPSVRLFMRPAFMKDYDKTSMGRTDIKIMSFNTMKFEMKIPDNQGRSTAETIGGFIAEDDVDIVCLQEFMDTAKYRPVIDSLLENLPYSHFSSYDVSRDPKGYQSTSHAIYSKYPIIRDGVVDVDSTFVRSVWVDLKIKNDTIRIISNHLQNTHISGDDRDFLMSGRVIRDSDNQGKIKNIFGKLRKNYRKRASQAELIADFRDESPYRTIICGDFNDTPMSFTYRTIGDGMSDAFAVKGTGMSSTYHGLFDMFRIDYIFFSDGFNVKRFDNYDIKYSDHTPISAVFEISERDL